MQTSTNSGALPARAGATLFAAWLLSLIATASALFIGEVMGMMPCVLCWYQRIAMFPLVLFLGMAVFTQARALVLPSLLLALAGLAMASYHTMLYWGWIDPTLAPCGDGPSCTQQVLQIFGAVDLPMLSWLAFATISFLLVFTLKASTHD
jgi:disulfide bond formation protein DsbB